MRKTWRGDRTFEAAVAHTTDEAVRSLARGDRTLFRRLVGELTDRPGTPGWSVAADRCLADRLRRGITSAWQRGWQPADLVRFTTRRHTTRHARLATDAIADEMRTYSPGTVDDRWHEQLAALQADVWWPDDGSHPSHWCRREEVARATYVTCAVELIHLLETLARLPPITPPPGTGKPRTGTPAGTVMARARSTQGTPAPIRTRTPRERLAPAGKRPVRGGPVVGHLGRPGAATGGRRPISGFWDGSVRFWPRPSRPSSPRRRRRSARAPRN